MKEKKKIGRRGLTPAVVGLSRVGWGNGPVWLPAAQRQRAESTYWCQGKKIHDENGDGKTE